MAHDLARQLIAHRQVVNSHSAYLGVPIANTNGQAARVAAVAARGPASKAGIQAGDLIVAADVHPTPTAGSLSAVLAELRPGWQPRTPLGDPRPIPLRE
ncbi:MAG: PDZ domain-containing protein [Candidatus Dormibacteraceae bacterium]